MDAKVEAIPEEPFELPAWDSASEQNCLDAITADAAGLMKRVAQLTQEQAESQLQHRKEMEKLLLAIIEALDSFDRVVANVSPKIDEVNPQRMRIWLGNFRTIRRLLEANLKQNGVVPIEAYPDVFDPHNHEAVNVVVDSSRPDGTVLGVERPGYLWRDQVLRKIGVQIVGAEEAVAILTGGRNPAQES